MFDPNSGEMTEAFARHVQISVWSRNRTQNRSLSVSPARRARRKHARARLTRGQLMHSVREEALEASDTFFKECVCVCVSACSQLYDNDPPSPHSRPKVGPLPWSECGGELRGGAKNIPLRNV